MKAKNKIKNNNEQFPLIVKRLTIIIYWQVNIFFNIYTLKKMMTYPSKCFERLQQQNQH